MECLENIVGVTKIDCDCLHSGLTPEKIEELKLSNSGIYLDDVEGGVYLHNINQIDKCVDFANIQLNAIDTAIKHFKTELISKILTSNRNKLKSYTGSIGRTTYTKSLNSTKSINFLKLSGKSYLSNMVLKAKNIRFIGNKSGSVTFKIIKQFEGELEGEILHESQEQIQANKFFTLNADVDEFVFSKDGQKINYYLVMENNEGINPLNIKKECNCPNGNKWNDLISINGNSVNNYSEMYQSNSSSLYTNGFTIEGMISCKLNDAICNKLNTQEEFALVMAWAIAYKANELVIENIVNSSEVTRFTLMRREILYGKRNHFKKEFSDRIDFLAYNSDFEETDCFDCKNTKMRFGGILS